MREILKPDRMVIRRGNGSYYKGTDGGKYTWTDAASEAYTFSSSVDLKVGERLISTNAINHYFAMLMSKNYITKRINPQFADVVY